MMVMTSTSSGHPSVTSRTRAGRRSWTDLMTTRPSATALWSISENMSIGRSGRTSEDRVHGTRDEAAAADPRRARTGVRADRDARASPFLDNVRISRDTCRNTIRGKKNGCGRPSRGERSRSLCLVSWWRTTRRALPTTRARIDAHRRRSSDDMSPLNEIQPAAAPDASPASVKPALDAPPRRHRRPARRTPRCPATSAGRTSSAGPTTGPTSSPPTRPPRRTRSLASPPRPSTPPSRTRRPPRRPPRPWWFRTRRI